MRQVNLQRYFSRERAFRAAELTALTERLSAWPGYTAQEARQQARQILRTGPQGPARVSYYTELPDGTLQRH